MNIKKSDLMITYHSERCYRLSIRKRVFLFIKKWVLLTYQETENSTEHPIEFSTFEAAEEFVSNVAE